MRSGGAASKFQYTGQERDAETGLHYYNARYYDPHIRRFTQPDIFVQDIYNPQSLNRYSYAFNNPLKYTDPSGHINILNYNRILSNPTAISYNNVLSQFAAIPGNTVLQNFLPSKSTSISMNNSNKSNNDSVLSAKNTVNSNTPIQSINKTNKNNLHKASTYVKSQLPTTGYRDISYSTGSIIDLFGGGICLKVNRDIIVPYISIGIFTPGQGVTELSSETNPKKNDESLNFGASLIKAINVSYPWTTEPVRLSSGEVTQGTGFPPGASINYNRTFDFYFGSGASLHIGNFLIT